MKSPFRLPGPTPVPPDVVEAASRPMIPHRGAAFRAFYRDLLDRLRRIHRTEQHVLVWPASGSAGWEIGVTNLFEPGNRVVVTVCGDFGHRFAAVAEAFGLDVIRLDAPWGTAITADMLAEQLQRATDVRGVFITHNETSTGVTNPLPDLARVAREHEALVLVDAVSSAAALPLEMDGWDLDLVISGSQKAWMCPPGLVIVGVSQRALQRSRSIDRPRFFWDLPAMHKAAEEGITPTTPALSLLFALDAAVGMIEREGLEEVWRRHERVGAMTRAGLSDLGLRLLAPHQFASNTVTAFRPPEGMTVGACVDALFAEFGITVAPGQAQLAEHIVRVGHMGWVDESDIAGFLAAIGQLAAAGSKREAITAAHG